LSSSALTSMMLLLLETFWNSCCGITFSAITFFWTSSISWIHPLKADLNFGNRQKSFRAKSGEQGGCSISGIYFWARNCLTESALWAGNHMKAPSLISSDNHTKFNADSWL
jgi:hypothetical protein